MAVFVTGATGFLGTEVVSSLLRSTDEIIYVLVRAEDEEAATHRLKSFWYEKKDLYSRIGSRIHPLAGDFTQPNLGLSRRSCHIHVRLHSIPLPVRIRYNNPNVNPK